MEEETPTEQGQASTFSNDNEEEGNSSPQLTVLTTVSYDYLDIPNSKPFDRMDIDNHNIDFDDSNQVSSTTESTIFQEPTTNEPVIHESMINVCVLHEPIVNESAVHEPIVDEPMVNEPILNEPVLIKLTGNIEPVENKTKSTRKRRRKSSNIRSSSPNTTPGQSRYGRIRKQKLSTDFISVDRKSFAVLNSTSYEPTISDSLDIKPSPEKPKRAYRKKPKITIEAALESATKDDSTDRSTPSNCNPNLPNVQNERIDVEEDESSRSSLNLSSIKTYSRKGDITSNLEEKSPVVKDVQVNYPELNWKVGDIAWAKIGCYPYWPSIVSLEYGSSIYVKSVGKQQNRLAVHVHFFGDRGRRSWVLTTSLIKYESKEQFMELKRQYIKDKLRMRYFFITSRIEDLWEKAVTEADTILKLSIDERTQYYQSLYPMTQEMYDIEAMNASKVKRTPVRRKKNPLERRGRKRKILNSKDIRNFQETKQSSENENTSVTNDEKNKKQREPIDEHTKKRRAFMRRMNQILKQSNVSSLPPKKRIKNQAKSEQLFNKLLHSTPQKNQNTSLNNSSSSPDSRKNDLSVYDFESDEETDVFIGTYNSKFTPQILNKIEERADDVDEKSKSTTSVKLPIYAAAVASTASPSNVEVEISTPQNEPQKNCETSPVEQAVAVVKRKPGRPPGAKNKVKNIGQKEQKGKPGNPLGLQNKKQGVMQQKRGRPFGSKNKVKSGTTLQNRRRGIDQNKRRLLKKKRLRGRPRKYPIEDTCNKVEKSGVSNDNNTTVATTAAEPDEKKDILEKAKKSAPEENLLTAINDLSSEDEFVKPDEETLRSQSPLSIPSTRCKKTVNIFIGVKNEKVCQICLKPGNTVRCRGTCCSYFHIECDQKISNSKETNGESKTASRRGRKRSSLKCVDADLVRNHEQNGDVTAKKEVDEKMETESTDAKSTNEDVTNSEALPKAENVEETNSIRVVRALRSIDVPDCMTCSAVSLDLERIEAKDVDPVTSTETLVNGETNLEDESTPGGKGDNMASKSTHHEAMNNGDAHQANSVEESPENEISSSTGQTEVSNENEKSNDSAETTKADEKINGVSAFEGEETCMSDASAENSKNGNGNGVDFYCTRCLEERMYPCFSCNKEIQESTKETLRYNCYLASCGRVYHKECLKPWPQASWGTGLSKESLRCPQHYCHTCISENPAVLKNKHCNEILVRCVKCPTSYHKRVHCIPAGTEILTSSQIICPRHYEPPAGMRHAHFNTSWCFICCIGGSLICCDECPTSFHAECLKLRPEEYEGRYICDDCQTGRFLLYGEIAWVKLGHYRWWPAKVLYPYEVPENIVHLPHRSGEFVVRFFGSHNYNWVNRGRAFLYQEGDSGKKSCKRSSVDMSFEKAMLEAEEAYKKLQVDKAARNEVAKVGLKPPRYVRIKANKPVGNVRILEMDTSNITACECDPKSEKPCAADSDCLNRMLLVECNPLMCPAGERCMNQAFEKRVYPPLMPYKTDKRGWGLKTLVDMKKGDFIIEYVGEMIDEEEYKRRVNIMHKKQEDNYYFLTIDKDRMLDAGPKGNVSRFMNHSCDPNCETQKWTVNGDTRIGLFALKDIPANSELVFNYNLASQGDEKKACYCGSEKCSGYIGIKAAKNGSTSTDEESRKKSNDELQKRSAEDGSLENNDGRAGSRIRARMLKKKRRRRLPVGAGKLATAKRTTNLRMKLKMKNRAVGLPSTKESTKASSETTSEQQNENATASENEITAANPQSDISNTAVEESQTTETRTSSDATRGKLCVTSSKIRFRSRGRPGKRLKKKLQQPLTEKGLLKSNTAVGAFTNPLLEKMFTNGDIFKKDPNKVVVKERSENEPYVERRGRKKIPKDASEKDNLLYQVIKRRVEQKVQRMFVSNVDDKCFKCGTKGELLFCDNNLCPRGYHLPCVNKAGWPTGRWLCPWHYCLICQSRCRILKCSECTNAFCGNHHKGNIFEESDDVYACKLHKTEKSIQAFFKSSTMMRIIVNSENGINESTSGLGSDRTRSLITPAIKRKRSASLGGGTFKAEMSNDQLPNKKRYIQEHALAQECGSSGKQVATESGATMNTPMKVSRTARKSMRSCLKLQEDVQPLVEPTTNTMPQDEDEDDFVLAQEEQVAAVSDDEYVDVEVEVLNDSE